MSDDISYIFFQQNWKCLLKRSVLIPIGQPNKFCNDMANTQNRHFHFLIEYLLHTHVATFDLLFSIQNIYNKCIVKSWKYRNSNYFSSEFFYINLIKTNLSLDFNFEQVWIWDTNVVKRLGLQECGEECVAEKLLKYLWGYS